MQENLGTWWGWEDVTFLWCFLCLFIYFPSFFNFIFPLITEFDGKFVQWLWNFHFLFPSLKIRSKTQSELIYRTVFLMVFLEGSAIRKICNDAQLFTTPLHKWNEIRYDELYLHLLRNSMENWTVEEVDSGKWKMLLGIRHSLPGWPSC